MHHGYQNPELGVRVDAFRGFHIVKDDEIMIHIFKEFDQKKNVVLTSIDKQKKKAILTISKKESPTVTVPIDIDDYKKKHEKGISTNLELTTNETRGAQGPEIFFKFTSNKSKKTESRAYFDGAILKFEQAKKITKTIGVYLASNLIENPNVIAERYGNLEVNKSENDVVQILKIIEPDLKKLVVRVVAGTPIIYGDIGKKKLIPTTLMGDGIGRLLRLALAITYAPKGIVIVDEIENGLHYTVIKKVWKAIAQLSRKYNTQIFATTHSRECIQSAYEAFKEDKKFDLLVHRLELIKGKITDVVYDEEALDAAMKSKFEVR